MGSSIVIPGREDHAEQLKGRLRPKDHLEVLWATGQKPDDVLAESWRTSHLRWAIINEGRVLGIFGLGRAEGVGVPWLLGSPELDQYGFAFARQSLHYLRIMLDVCPFLINHVWSGNDTSIKWLKWCGFEFGELVAHGPAREPFYPFSMRRALDV